MSPSSERFNDLIIFFSPKLIGEDQKVGGVLISVIHKSDLLHMGSYESTDTDSHNKVRVEQASIVHFSCFHHQDLHMYKYNPIMPVNMKFPAALHRLLGAADVAALESLSRAEIASQSLHQIKVVHLHSVFFSLSPDGPSGRGHIQNDLPQFIPLFFVWKLMQGSLWLSHMGAAGLVKSLHHDFLLSTSS